MGARGRAAAAAIRDYERSPRPGLVRWFRTLGAAGRWAGRELARLRREVDSRGFSVEIAAPPVTGRGALAGATLRLRAGRASCFERAFIMQRWWAERGVLLDVVIGVRTPSARTSAPQAHAWLEHWEADRSDSYSVIRRVPPAGIQSGRS